MSAKLPALLAGTVLLGMAPRLTQSRPTSSPGRPRTLRRADAEPLTPGEGVGVQMALYATSVRIEAGHRLRIAIAGHDASTFVRYPGDGAPDLTFMHSPASPSFQELPVASD